MAQARSTELDAVNTILRMLGRMPVNSLDAADLTPDAAFALAELRYESRSIQALGWHFNSERAVKFTVDGNDEVVIPDDVASLDGSKRSRSNTGMLDLTMRKDPADDQMKLWDKNADQRDDDPFKFPQVADIRLDIIRLLDFDSTPEGFRHYVTIRTGRAVQARLVTDPALYRFSSDDEARALQILMREELDNGDINALNEAKTARIVRRRSPIDRLESM